MEKSAEVLEHAKQGPVIRSQPLVQESEGVEEKIAPV